MMHSYRVQELRGELDQLIRKQTEFLESPTFAGANDTELLEYEIRQDMIHDLCKELADCARKDFASQCFLTPHGMS
jgi:hypothetical protein